MGGDCPPCPPATYAHANGLVIESRPTAVGENFQVVCTSLKTTDDYEEGVKFHSAIAAVKMAAATAAVQWRRRWCRLW